MRLPSSLAALILLAATGPAFADATLPSPHPGPSDWRTSCAARLERAREEAARVDPLFVYGFVETLGREQAAPGDPSATATVDSVEMKIEVSLGQMYLVRVEPQGDVAVSSRWSAFQYAGREVSLATARAQRGLVGTLVVTSGERRTVSVFERAFRRAVDECLASGTVR